jgi:solute carrier family 25 (mitochondrial adenine nucleotide translocator), member 4/5/6/31
LKVIWAQISVIVAEQLSYPGDTIKRKLFMQACRAEKEYNGILDCAVKVYKQSGIQGLWKGAGSNILRGVGSSLCLILYDEIKIHFGKTS